MNVLIFLFYHTGDTWVWYDVGKGNRQVKKQPFRLPEKEYCDMDSDFAQILKILAILAVFAAIFGGGVYLLSLIPWIAAAKLQIANGIVLGISVVLQLVGGLMQRWFLGIDWIKKATTIAMIVSLPLWVILLAGMLAI